MNRALMFAITKTIVNVYWLINVCWLINVQLTHLAVLHLVTLSESVDFLVNLSPVNDEKLTMEQKKDEI